MYKSTSDFKIISILLTERLMFEIAKAITGIGSWAYVLTHIAGEIHNVN